MDTFFGRGIFAVMALAGVGTRLYAGSAENSKPLAANAVAAFGVDLLRQIGAQPGNVFFSPYTISSCLTLLASGASGETQAELLRALHGGSDAGNLFSEFGKTSQNFGSAAGDGILTMATGLWVQRDAMLRPAFLASARAAYHAEVRAVDFSHPGAPISDEINAWVNEKTHGKIQNIVGPEATGPGTRLVVADAIYFKGKWAAPFEKKDTTDEPFFTDRGRWVRAPFLRQTSMFRYYGDKNYQALELTYDNSALSMVILLPRSADGMGKFQADLTAENLRVALAALDFTKKQEVEVWLPKFTTRHKTNLAQVLPALGVRKAFGRGADFSGIGDKLYVSAATHHAFVAVDEEGTEAAAADVVTMSSFSIVAHPPPVEFKADHPFLFLIRENTTGLILFLGRLSDPQG